MKNKIFAVTFLALIISVLSCLYLGIGISELSGIVFPIGTTNLHDTTSSTLSINKGLKVNGTLDANSYKLQSGEVIKQKFVKLPITVIGTGTNQIAHGITNYRKIIAVDCVIIEDTLEYYLPLGYNGAAGYNTGFLGQVRGANCYYYIASAQGYRLLYDTVLFKLTYIE